MNNLCHRRLLRFILLVSGWITLTTLEDTKKLVSCPPVALSAVSPNPLGVQVSSSERYHRLPGNFSLGGEGGGGSIWSHRVLEQQHVLCPRAKLPQAPPTGPAAARARHRPYIKRTVACRLISSSSRELTDGGQYAELNYKWAIVTTNTSSTSSHPHLPTASGANNSEDIS